MKRSLIQTHPKRVDVPVLLGASAVLLTLGLNLPILTVRKIWETNTFSVYSGIINLYHDKQFFLAFIVFFFSIVFPIVKLAALFVIWFLPLAEAERKKVLYWLSGMGKWSMLDVFIVAVIIVAVKLGALASAKAEEGIYFFGASILLAMAATALQNRLAKKSRAL